MVGDRVCVCDRTGRGHTMGDRLARGAAGPAIPSRHRRGAPEPASRRLADVAPDAEQLGLQPAPGHHREQRPLSADGVDARSRAWPPGGHAARARRRDVLPQSPRRRRSHRRQDRRSEMAVPSQAARGSQQVLSGARHQPEPGDLREPHHRHECRRLRLRLERPDWRARVGDEDPRLPEGRPADVRPHRRQRQGDFRTGMRARRRPRGVRDHRA